MRLVLRDLEWLIAFAEEDAREVAVEAEEAAAEARFAEEDAREAAADAERAAAEARAAAEPVQVLVRLGWELPSWAVDAGVAKQSTPSAFTTATRPAASRPSAMTSSKVARRANYAAESDPYAEFNIEMETADDFGPLLDRVFPRIR